MTVWPANWIGGIQEFIGKVMDFFDPPPSEREYAKQKIESGEWDQKTYDRYMEVLDTAEAYDKAEAKIIERKKK